MALVTGDKAMQENAAAKNRAQEEMMMEEMMMQKTREAYEKAKAELKAGENHVPERAAQEADDAGHTMGIGAFTPGEGAELEIPVLNGLVEGLFGGATVHIENVTIHVGDHMESVNFMGDAEVETEETEEEMEAGEWADGDAQEDGCDECETCNGCGFGARHPIYVDTDLMEKIVAISTGLDRKTVAAVLKGVGFYLQVLAEDEEERGIEMADKAAGTNTTNLVAVDIGRLGESLQAVFSGIAGVFGALGVPTADTADVPGNMEITVTGSEGIRTPKVQKADSETANNGKGKKGNGAGDEDGSEERSDDGPAGKEADGKPEGTDVGVLDADHAGMAGDADAGGDRQVKSQAAGSVTADDITKVIVAKIKQDRSNNQKIGALLPAYGVEKVSALKPEQYEAFLTDISQI